MKRIGLLGGSFDPLHLAHIALARNALQALRLDQVQFIPAAHSWQRHAPQATARQRCDMIRLAIADAPHFSLNTVEIERGGATYTINTVQALPPGAVYIWLLGADQLQNFCTWKAWQAIVDRVELAAAARPGTPLRPPPELVHYLACQGRPPVYKLSLPEMHISASEIRKQLAHNLNVDAQLPEPVRQYIHTYHLYQSSGYRHEMDIQTLQSTLLESLADLKAQDVSVFNTTRLTSLFDRIVIASATSNRHARAVASGIADRVRACKLTVTVEGEESAEWIIVDVGDIVVHVMQHTVRAYYNLEEIWGEHPITVPLLPGSTSPSPLASLASMPYHQP